MDKEAMAKLGNEMFEDSISPLITVGVYFHSLTGDALKAAVEREDKSGAEAILRNWLTASAALNKAKANVEKVRAKLRGY